MDFTNDELILISRALLDAAGKLKADHLNNLPGGQRETAACGAEYVS